MPGCVIAVHLPRMQLSLELRTSLISFNTCNNSDNHQKLCLVSLTFWPVFYTISQDLLLYRFSSWSGISGTALHWSQSYLSSRSFYAKAATMAHSPFPSLAVFPKALHPVHYITKLSHRIPLSTTIFTKMTLNSSFLLQLFFLLHCPIT